MAWQRDHHKLSPFDIQSSYIIEYDWLKIGSLLVTMDQKWLGLGAYIERIFGEHLSYMTLY